MKVFIDSDVLLDFFFDRAPFSQASAALISACEQGRISGCTTPLVLSNMYYLLRQKAGRDKALKCIHYLLDYLEIIAMDRESVLIAIDSGFTDFEDGLQYGSALGDQTIQGIVTRNVKDYRKSKLSVHTPNGLLAMLPQI